MLFTRPENQAVTGKLPALKQSSAMEEELQRCKEKLAYLEAHPYVRVGKAVNRLLKKIMVRK